MIAAKSIKREDEQWPGSTNLNESVYTFNHSYKKRLRALSEEYPDYYTRDERKNLAEGAEIYLIDKSLCTLTFRRPRSEEVRNKARQRAKKNGFGNN